MRWVCAGPVAISSPYPPGCWLVFRRSPRLEAARSTPMGTATAQRLTAIPHREEKVYVVECPEVGTVSQGDTVEEALANLREASELFLEECPQPAMLPRLLTTFEKRQQFFSIIFTGPRSRMNIGSPPPDHFRGVTKLVYHFTARSTNREMPPCISTGAETCRSPFRFFCRMISTSGALA